MRQPLQYSADCLMSIYQYVKRKPPSGVSILQIQIQIQAQIMLWTEWILQNDFYRMNLHGIFDRINSHSEQSKSTNDVMNWMNFTEWILQNEFTRNFLTELTRIRSNQKGAHYEKFDGLTLCEAPRNLDSWSRVLSGSPSDTWHT